MFKIKTTLKPRDIFNDVVFTPNDESDCLYILKYIKNIDRYMVFNVHYKIDLSSGRGTRILEMVTQMFETGQWIRVEN